MHLFPHLGHNEGKVAPKPFDQGIVIEARKKQHSSHSNSGKCSRRCVKQKFNKQDCFGERILACMK